MTLTADIPAVVVLDVMNLRDRRRDRQQPRPREDKPFEIAHFDRYVTELRRILPGLVVIGVVDGTAVFKWNRRVFATQDDQTELLRRTALDPSDVNHLYLLPPPKKRFLQEDLKYLKADPVCIHLLEKYEPNVGLITSDLHNKPGDVAYFPLDHPLREKIFAPFWLGREDRCAFLSRPQLSQFSNGWDTTFFDAVANGEVLRIEDRLRVPANSGRLHGEVREDVYGHIHDIVNEHRAAANRTVPIVLEWQKSSFFSGLNPADFPSVSSDASEDVSGDVVELDDVGYSSVRVDVATTVDLSRSVHELSDYVGRRVRLHAMVRVVEGVPYLFWLGNLARVRIVVDGSQTLPREGFAWLQGLVTDDGGALALVLDAAGGVSIAEAVKDRVSRVVRRIPFRRSNSPWSLPPITDKSERAPSGTIGGGPTGPVETGTNDVKDYSDTGRTVKVGDTTKENSKGTTRGQTTTTGTEGGGDGGNTGTTVEPDDRGEGTDKKWQRFAIRAAIALAAATALVIALRSL